jgi:hypothetical protein
MGRSKGGDGGCGIKNWVKEKDCVVKGASNGGNTMTVKQNPNKCQMSAQSHLQTNIA